jgi:sulfate transport system ATP-binding protein
VTTVFVTHDQLEAMEVADQIAVLDHGRVEQVGTPRELYDEPASEFVMRFVGEAHVFGDALVRPHDLELLLQPEGDAVEAQVERVTVLGFEARVELTGARDEQLTVQLTRQQLEELELAPGDIVWVRASRERAFA